MRSLLRELVTSGEIRSDTTVFAVAFLSVIPAENLLFLFPQKSCALSPESPALSGVGEKILKRRQPSRHFHCRVVIGKR